MKKLLFILIPLFIQSQCNEGEYEILFSTWSGEWAEEISWTIIDNDGNNLLFIS